jgi:hypothetical protein
MRTFFDWLFGNPDEFFASPTPAQDEVVQEFTGEPHDGIANETMGDWLKELGLRVVHIRPDTDPSQWHGRHNGVTVVYLPRRDNRHTIEVATAICSTTDTFSRKKGLQLALTRFLQGKTTNLPANHGEYNDVELLKTYFV